MATKESYKRLQDSLAQFDENNKAIKDGIKKVDTAKKDKDSKQSLEVLDGELRGALQNIKQLEKEITDAQDAINNKLGRKSTEPRMREMPGIRGILQKRNRVLMRQIENLKSVERPRPSSSNDDRKKPLDPEEQEMAYELKSQLLKNVVMQNEKLKTEFTLHEKLTESRLLSQQNRRLHEDITMSRANSMKLIKMFERKAKEADVKLKEITAELHRAQDLAEKYRNLYELERRKGTKDSGEHLPPVVEDDKLPQNQSSYTFLGGNIRVNDVIRKNEVLVEENTDLRREIRRLKEDNGKLIKQTKGAMSDRDHILHKLETSEANRRNLLKRLDKEKGQHQMLSRSLTRQASDWILLKKQIAQFDEEYRWSQVIGLWLKNAKNRGKQVFPPLAPDPLQEMVASEPPLREDKGSLEDGERSSSKND